MRVIARRGSANWTTAIKEVTYSLLSGPTAFIYNASDNKEILNDLNQTYNPRVFNVYFKEAGDETVFASGVHESGSQRLVFTGTLDIKVRPGIPDHVVFLKPIPKAQLAGATPPAINSGVGEVVTVEVQDKFGNAVDVAAQVSIRSESPDIGDVGAPGAIATKTVSSAAATGVATFEARVTKGKPRDEFDMTATLLGTNVPANNAGNTYNVGRLRVGRAVDALMVFYSDSGAAKNTVVDASVTIEGQAGEWFKVTVKTVAGGTVVNRNGQSVYVEPTEGLKLSATSGGASASRFTITNGIATFWVSADESIEGCLDVYVLNAGAAGDDDRDGSVVSGNRCGITFMKPSSNSILRAVVFGDGQGRPDSLLLYFADGGQSLTAAGSQAMPSMVTLMWPRPTDGVELTAGASAISVRGDYILHVNMTGVASRPSGFTSIAGSGRGLVKVYGVGGVADAVDMNFDVYDGVGPVLANHLDAGGNPQIVENRNAGVDADTIKLNLSELPRVPTGSNIKLLYLKTTGDAPDPAVGGTVLTVLDAWLEDASTNAYTVVVAPVTGGLQKGDWIRLDPSGDLTDRAAQAKSAIDDYEHPDNRAHANNRWVQLREIAEAAPPAVRSAYYTSNYTETGYINFVYVEFDKPADGFVRWFAGGTVFFDSLVAVTDNSITKGIFKVHPDPDSSRWMVIDLRQAYKSYPKVIRTDGDIAFSLSFGKDMVDGDGKKWGDLNGVARDGAKPVLADTVTLKSGEVMENGARAKDTLIVIYSERLDNVSLRLAEPVTFMLSNGERCAPTLSSPLAMQEGGYYRVIYEIEDELDTLCGRFPAVGDRVRINSEAGVRDGFGNKQDMPDNLMQPLITDRKQKWTARFRNNPFASGSGRYLSVALSPNAVGAEEVSVSAKFMVFNNEGALVADTEITARNNVEWRWNGAGKNGRLVETGTYFLKAVCNADVDGVRFRYTVTKYIGVVRGGKFAGWPNLSKRLSGGSVNFFWDGDAIKGGALSVYDASGNTVRKIIIKDNAASGAENAPIGSWDLTDANGRPAGEGTYLVKGVIETANGRKERVSAIIGVGR
jgi:flagellar hook assembly protein FlgD